MDIIVTTPKTEMNAAAAEAEYIKTVGGGYYHRFFNTLPKVSIGDKVFYVENGFITGFAICIIHSEMGVQLIKVDCITQRRV